MNLHADLAERVIEEYGPCLMGMPNVSHDALTLELDNGIVLQARFAGDGSAIKLIFESLLNLISLMTSSAKYIIDALLIICFFVCIKFCIQRFKIQRFFRY